MLEYPQTDPRMCPASQNLFTLAMNQRVGYDPEHEHAAALARHVRSVVPAERNGAWRISKPRGSKKHIDAAVATAIAVFEATRGAEEPERRPTPRIY